MDCPVCWENQQSNVLVFKFGEIDSIPGEVEDVSTPEKFPTNAECSVDTDHTFLVEVDEELGVVTLILEAQVPNEDDTYDFPLEDFEFDLS